MVKAVKTDIGSANNMKVDEGCWIAIVALEGSVPTCPWFIRSDETVPIYVMPT